MAKTRVGIRNGALFNPTSTLWNNLLAYYTADNTPNDALGNYNGTLVNGTTYGTGKINKGFSFDGVNDSVSISSLNYINTSTPITISCWINSNGTSGSIVQNLFNNTTGYNLFIFGGIIKFRVASGSFPNEIRKQLTSTISTSTWYHIVVTYDGSADVNGIKIYLNNTEPTSSNPYNACTSTSLTSTSTFISGNSSFFNGLIDEVGVWNRVLSPTEVTELYNSGSGKQYPVVRDFLTATGISDPTIVSAINTLTSDLQGYGIWDKLEAIYPFVGGTSETHRYNLKDATKYRIDWNGGVTHNSNGITGDGSTGYGNTNFIDSLFLTNYMSFGVYSRTNVTSSSAFDMASSSSGSANIIGSRFSASGGYNTIMDGTSKYIPTSDSLGLFCANRTSTTDRQGYKNGVETTFTNTQAGYTNKNMYVLARNNNDTSVDYYSPRNLAFAFIGNSLTTTEHVNLYTAVQAFQTTLGRNV